MSKSSSPEALLEAWVTLSGTIKNCRITKGLLYNEAIIMNILYRGYLDDGDGMVSIREITQKTKMLKSLVNRTVNSLERKGFLNRCESSGDKRVVYVKCVKEKLDTFLKIHTASVMHASNIIDIIGDEDAEAFVRIVDKIERSGYSLL